MNTYTKSRHSRSSNTASRRRTFSNSKQNSGRFRGGRKISRGFNGGFGNGSKGKRTPRKMPTFNPSQFINTNPVDLIQEKYTPKHSFKTFGLRDVLVKTITSIGLETPTPIQDQIIPEILNGRDVIGLAETGTGKTAAFLIPIIEKTLGDMRRETLILAPTRELALQIDAELQRLAARNKIFSVICVGGVNIQPQIRALHRKNHFIIGTPGRILDLIKRRQFVPNNISTVVLDEADRMLDMGFINDMKKILSTTPTGRETLFFSATMSADVKNLVHNFLKNPITISVKKKDVTNSIEQNIVSYNNNKFETLTSLLSGEEFNRVLIFGSMKHSVEKLARQLTKSGVEAESIHGNKSHGQRQRALTKFKNGSARVLVATDVAARGIHVEDVTHVINYDLPNTFEDYVHRIGRTGRATKLGKALTFVSK